MGLIRDSHPDIKLLFLSTTHANPLLPEFDMAKIALGKARELGVYERTVFFNENWIPYEKRTDYFGAADVGVSTHSIHLETRYSFRTRFLEYLNFDLPMVSTEGDHLSGVLRERGALVTVKENDVNGLKEVILRLHSDEVFYNNMVKAVKGIKVRYTWEQVLRPLVERLKMMDASSIEKVRPGTQPVENADNRILRFLKRRCPFLKRFKNKPFFIKIGRYLGR
jgi:hypothetical protein